MKLNGKDITNLDNDQLMITYTNFLKLENARNSARQNEKFKGPWQLGNTVVPKLDFAETNPAFIELKQALLNEIINRKLDINNVPQE